MEYPANGCLSVSGSRGTGKSTLVGHLLNYRGVRRRIILDPLEDYPKKVECHARSIEAVDNYLDDDFMEVTTPFSVAYTPDDLPEVAAVEHLTNWAFYMRNCVLMVEEAHESLVHPDCPRNVIRMAKRGRHFNVGLWCISQKPKDISPHLRSELNANETWYLRLSEEDDLSLLAKRRGPEFADLVRDLPNFQAVRVVPGVSRWEMWQITPREMYRRY